MTTTTASVPGTPGVVFHPTNLGADGYDHPILTYGNGTFGTCEGESPGQRHLASWGYVVVCPESGWTGSGAEILAAAQWLVDQDSNADSVFFDKLDTTKVGTFGGSQGASGAVNAMIQSNGLITSTATIALVDPAWHIWGPPPDFSQVQDPVFLTSGLEDFLISQEQQQAYVDQVPGAAAKAALIDAGHDERMAAAHGYIAAWFEYTLEGDQFARSAFVETGGNPPELSTDSAWTNWAAKNLP